MNVSCPACSNAMTIGPEHLGQVVQCPHCRQTIQIPATQGPVAEPTKTCFNCGETILQVARRCKFCKTDIPEGFDEYSAAGRLKAKEPLVAQQAATPQCDLPYSVKGRFQVGTIVVSVLLLICILGAAIGLPGGDRNNGLFPIGIFGMIFGCLFLLITLILGLRDLFAIQYDGRTTPLRGAKAFLGGLCGRRYRFAYYCVLDADKDDLPRLRPALPNFGVQADSFCFDTFEDFRNYWKTFLHKDGTRATLSNVQVVRTQGDFAEVTADIHLVQQSTASTLLVGWLLASIFATRDSLSVKKLFRYVGGQWCAVNGEVDSGEDRFGMTILKTRR